MNNKENKILNTRFWKGIIRVSVHNFRVLSMGYAIMLLGTVPYILFEIGKSLNKHNFVDSIALISMDFYEFAALTMLLVLAVMIAIILITIAYSFVYEHKKLKTLSENVSKDADL